jgi:hypothetical protein
MLAAELHQWTDGGKGENWCANCQETCYMIIRPDPVISAQTSPRLRYARATRVPGNSLTSEARIELI